MSFSAEFGHIVLFECTLFGLFSRETTTRFDVSCGQLICSRLNSLNTGPDSSIQNTSGAYLLLIGSLCCERIPIPKGSQWKTADFRGLIEDDQSLAASSAAGPGRRKRTSSKRAPWQPFLFGLCICCHWPSTLSYRPNSGSDPLGVAGLFGETYPFHLGSKGNQRPGLGSDSLF